MPAFGITPVGAFPPATSDGFPRFIQFQQDGSDVGDTAVEVVNFTGDVALSLSSDGSTVTVDVTGGTPAGAFTWLEISGDYTLQLTDADRGLATTDASGTQSITIPPEASVAFDAGAAVLVHQDGGAQAQIVAGSGVTLSYRTAAFNPYAAGEGAILTLIYRGSDRWIVCGDMEAL